jgi:ornithine cyclodeaminase
VRIITAPEVEAHLDIDACIAAMRQAMVAVSEGHAELPLRQFMAVPGAPGKLAMMPGVLGDPWCFGMKLVCKYERAADSPLGTHVGMVLLFDAAEGVPLAIIEGSTLTGIRTAAASALATDLLARRDASRLLVLGCGEQARRHVTALRRVRSIDRVTVWGRNAERARAFADAVAAAEELPVAVAAALPAALADADIVCTTPSAPEPILAGDDLVPGTHLNLVGSAIPGTAEVDARCVARSRYFVDYRAAAEAAAGEFLRALEAGAVTRAHMLAEIGEVALGRHPGRRDDSDITLYKSLGVAAQDLAAAHLLYREAERAGFGTRIDLLGG